MGMYECDDMFGDMFVDGNSIGAEVSGVLLSPVSASRLVEDSSCVDSKLCTDMSVTELGEDGIDV
jgi:hypothetical protein